MQVVTEMLDEVHSKLYLEKKVAMYEVDTRRDGLYEEVMEYVNEILDVLHGRNRANAQPEEEKKDEQAAQ